MSYTQKEIYDYLKANPLEALVAVGSVETTNGADYIFLDYESDELIPSDNKGCYQTYLQVTIATRNFTDRKILTDYVKEFLPVSVTYEKSAEFEFYMAMCTCGVLIHEEV